MLASLSILAMDQLVCDFLKPLLILSYLSPLLEVIGSILMSSFNSQQSSFRSYINEFPGLIHSSMI